MLALTWRLLFPCCLMFKDSESSFQAIEEKLKPTVLVGCGVSVPHYQNVMKDKFTDTMKAQLLWVQPTACRLGLKSVAQEGTHILYFGQGQSPMIDEPKSPSVHTMSHCFVNCLA